MMSHRYRLNSARVDIDTALAALSRGIGSAAGVQLILAILKNTSTIESVAPIGPSTVPAFDSAPFKTVAGGAGKVQIRAMILATGIGGTAIAGDDVEFRLRVDGATLPGGPLRAATLPAVNLAAGATIPWQVNTTPGSTHTYGIEAVDLTTPGNTLTIPSLTAVIQLQEVFGGP